MKEIEDRLFKQLKNYVEGRVEFIEIGGESDMESMTNNNQEGFDIDFDDDDDDEIGNQIK